jgi:hypothetical protein
MESTAWDQVRDARPGESWLVATENGFGAMTAWAAGTDNVRRTPITDLGRTVRVESHGADGRVRSWIEPFTLADREVVDEAIESYLAAAGIPAPPRGWTWLIRRPVTLGDDRQFWAHLNQQIAQYTSAAPLPAEIAPILQRTMTELYADI